MNTSSQKVALVHSLGSKTTQQGFSLLEILVVIAALGIILSVTLGVFRAPSSRLYANDVNALLQQARFQAIKHDEAVAVVWDATDQAMVTRLNSGGAVSCSSLDTTELSKKPLTDYRKLSVKTTLEGNGLLWLPNGQIRGCNGGSGSGSLTVTDERSSLILNISATGKVSIP